MQIIAPSAHVAPVYVGKMPNDKKRLRQFVELCLWASERHGIQVTKCPPAVARGSEFSRLQRPTVR